MKITLDDIRQKFDALNGETESREEIADFATRAMEADDAGSLEMEPAFADKIWKSLLYLSGVDLKDEPDRYLHSTGDFAEARRGLGV